MKILNILFIASDLTVLVVGVIIASKSIEKPYMLEYTPVCGIDGKTYPNECTADVDIAYEGVCMHVCTNTELEAMICTMEWNPVCGENGKTYGNGCSACNAKQNYVKGEC